MEPEREERARGLVEQLAGNSQFSGFVIAGGTVVLRQSGAPYTDTPTMFNVEALDDAVTLGLLKKRRVTGSFEWDWYKLKVTLPLEAYLERADEFAQNVVNAWGQNVQAGNGAMLSDDFKDVLEKACRYRDAKKVADNRRQFAMLSETQSGAEASARQDFAESYKAFRERHDT